MSTIQTEIRVKGKDTHVPAVQIEGRTVITSGRWLKKASVKDEDLLEGETVSDPESFVSELKQSSLSADIFTFAQKLPGITPQYKYLVEWENFAVIPITTYSDWFKNRVESSVQRSIRKATKLGVRVELAKFDDNFVKGIVSINNEVPIRQGKPFWHFQKSFEAVKKENSTYAERNAFLGAYFDDELIGFIRMTCVGRVANIVQVLSKVKHFDKRPSNALIAKAVEICEEKGIAYLMYCNYVYNDPNSSLTEFKRRNGFEKVLLPRYYIPLTRKGEIALRLGMHRTVAQRIPQPLVIQLLKIRSFWYELRAKSPKVIG